MNILRLVRHYENPVRRPLRSSLLVFPALLLAACGDVADSSGHVGGGGANTVTTSNTATTSTAITTTTTTPKEACGFLAADAGSVQTVEPFDVVTLHGSATSVGCGATLQFAWETGFGNDVVLDDPSAQTPSFTAPMNLGPLDFFLRVTDEEGQTATSATTVIVGHAPPVAHAGPDKGALGGAPVTLAGSGSDPLDLALTFQWTQIAGPAVTLTHPASATPSFMLPADTTQPLVFSLTVNNGYLDSEPDWVTVRRLVGPDTDGDLLEDDLEITLGTDPEDADTDHDGIPDGWEVLGHEDVDYVGLGCNPLHRDLLVEVAAQEYMANGTLHSARPSPALWATVADFYAALPLQNPDGLTGVSLHVVDGAILDEGFACAGANGAVESCIVYEAPGNFVYREAFHKASFCIGSLGCGDLGRRRLSVGFDAASDNDLEGPGAFMFYRLFIHEMGHNLGLSHGGGDTVNLKPNYPSVMNYSYLANASSQTFATGHMEFSHGLLPPLDECAVVEQGIFAGLPPESVALLSTYEVDKGWSVAADGSVDWNRDGIVSAEPYSMVLRLNAVAPLQCTLLEDHDDFATLDGGFSAALATTESAAKVIPVAAKPKSVR